ncbi:imidazole glycerol phosphate synthase subunit HisH [Balneola sp. MJW-20]|uniref:imidazole glycerol phosphate synthase subunit HisH n=1 Tax=Gracilimonas aurantiaca TaxID=3234185 RepID=UPI003467AC13
MSKITIINYGAGNLLSVNNMLKKAGARDALITDKKEDIVKAEKLILPGVGHFDYGMQELNESGLIPILEQRVLTEKIPILGICLGAQLMTEFSEEGNINGLGWVNGKTIAFDKTKLPSGYKIPHMGWNDIFENKETPLFQAVPENPRFYFVHSYHLEMENEKDVWLTANYGYDFCAAYQKENIYACQFHPEKSHKFGLQLMKNFIAL